MANTSLGEVKQGDCRWVYCGTCERETRHELKAVESREHLETRFEGGYEVPTHWEKWEYRLWICRGCDSGTFEEAWTCMGMEDRNGRTVWDTTSYPKRNRGRSPKRFRRLDRKLETIYKEVIESFNAGLDVLCAVGLRALLEGICAEKGITEGNLQRKIDELESHGLPPNIVAGLHGFRFMGNTAAHELEAPREEDLRAAIDVMEDLLNFLYELEYKVRELLKRGSGREQKPQ